MLKLLLTVSLLVQCLLSLVVVGYAQADHPHSTLVVNGRSGDAPVMQLNGSTFADLTAIARITKGSIQFESNRVVLTIPCSSVDTSPQAQAHTSAPAGLSPEFMKSSIETLANMREWASTLAFAIQNGYGVTESWISNYREQAANSLRMSSAAASTDADRNALQLLTHEFEAVKEWSDALIDAKNRMDVGKYALSPDALRESPSSQKIIRCGRFLASMLGSATFQDDAACH